MKKILTIVAFVMAVTSLCAKDIKTIVFTTEPPMSCENCENKIKGNLRFEKGVKGIETNVPAQEVKISYDAEKTDQASLESAFGKIGYKVVVKDCAGSVQAQKVCGKSDKTCTKSEGSGCGQVRKNECSGKKRGCCQEKKVCSGEKKECAEKCTEKK